MHQSSLKIPLLFASAKLLLHLFTNAGYGFHRDEFLYLALGRHLDWGYWSNPPLIGFLSFLSQSVLGDSVFTTRLIPALFGAGTVFLTCLMARELGGKKFAQSLAGIVAFSSLAYLRSGHMFMPVVIDIFFWALAAWLLIRYLRKQENKWLLWLGVALGVGFLNKYSVAFLIMALAIGLLLTPERRIFLKKQTWLAAGLALLIVLPNLIWQWQYNFPVVAHLGNLAETQLSTVNPLIFLLDQLLMHLWGLIVWVPGLFFLLRKTDMRPFRAIGWAYVATLVLFLVLGGKNYYTLGAYPMLMAAGGVFWEKTLRTTWKRLALAGAILFANLSALPAALPFLSVPDSVAYFRRLGIDSLTRWERGNLEALPQDYADMLGWEELARLVDEAVERSGNPAACLIYAENYGQAGAIERFAKHPALPTVASFADSYRLWAPDTLQAGANTLIYVNDELGDDVAELFASHVLVGEVTTEHARERGTQVYLLQEPQGDVRAFWAERVKMVKGSFRGE